MGERCPPSDISNEEIFQVAVRQRRISMGMSAEEIQAQRLGKPAEVAPVPSTETAPTDTTEKVIE